MALSLYLSLAIPLLLFLLLILWALLHRLKNKWVFRTAALLLILLYCLFAFDGIIDAHRHLRYYQKLQGADAAKIAEIERFKWFTERKNGRVAGYWWFNIQYAEDAGIEYSYHYDPNAGMRCRIRHIGDHLPSSERLYYPLDGYVTLP